MPSANRTASGRPYMALLALTIVVMVFAGLFKLTAAIDRHEDRDRPLYHDVILMSALQYDLLSKGHAGVEMTLDEDSQPVQVGGTLFTVSAGVSLIVEERPQGVCVMGRNQFGDQTRWKCVDGSGQRPILGALG